jgi:hypothetical protein
VKNPKATIVMGEAQREAIGAIRAAYLRHVEIPEGAAMRPDVPKPVVEQDPTDEQLYRFAAVFLGHLVGAHPDVIAQEMRRHPGFPEGTPQGARCAVTLAGFVTAGVNFKQIQAGVMREQAARSGVVTPDGRPSEVARKQRAGVVPINGGKPR